MIGEVHILILMLMVAFFLLPSVVDVKIHISSNNIR